LKKYDIIMTSMGWNFGVVITRDGRSQKNWLRNRIQLRRQRLRIRLWIWLASKF